LDASRRKFVYLIEFTSDWLDIGMKIAFDIEAALISPTGVGKYARRVVQFLVSHSDENEYWFYCSATAAKSNPAYIESLARDNSVYKLKSSRRAMRIAAMFGLRPITVRSPFPSTPDINFSPSGYVIPFKAKKTYGMIHDINTIDIPEASTVVERFVTRREFSQVVSRSDKVVTCSEFSRGRIVSHWNLDADKVQAIYEGADNGEDGEDSTQKAVSAEIHGLANEGPYFLWSGAMMKRKNLPLLLTAFKSLITENDHVKLILAGVNGNDSKEVFRLIAAEGMSDRVKHVGYVSEADLQFLIDNCVAYVYPSIYEGFGLPVIEAMARGIPVITSNTSATAEIAGDSAVLIDPHDATDVSRAMIHLLEDVDERKRLGQAGIVRAKKYTWDSTVEQLLELFTSGE